MIDTPRVLAPFLPNYVQNSSDTSDTLNRLENALSCWDCKKAGETVDVQTGVRMYQNMMLVNMGITQAGSAEFTLTLREIFIFASQTAQGLHPDLKNHPRKRRNWAKHNRKIHCVAMGKNQLFISTEKDLVAMWKKRKTFIGW